MHKFNLGAIFLPDWSFFSLSLSLSVQTQSQATPEIGFFLLLFFPLLKSPSSLSSLCVCIISINLLCQWQDPWFNLQPTLLVLGCCCNQGITLLSATIKRCMYVCVCVCTYGEKQMMGSIFDTKV